jgi:hypothetical protein
MQPNHTRKAAKARALELLDGAPVDVIERLAARARLTGPAMRRRLKSDCHWQPEAVIALLGGGEREAE